MLSTLKVVQIEVKNWERINLRAKIFSVTSPQEISGRLYRTRRALYLLAAFLGIAFAALATLVINQVVSAPIGLNPSHRNIDNLALLLNRSQLLLTTWISILIRIRKRRKGLMMINPEPSAIISRTGDRPL